MRVQWLFCTLLFTSLTADCARADDAPLRLEVFPTKLELSSKRARAQIVVTGHYAGGETRDLTRQVEWMTSPAEIVEVRDGVAFPQSDGAATIHIKAGNLAQIIPVVISNQAKPDPVRFNSEIVAVLTKQGCNSGSCHGSPQGKGGFALSLFGYDPRIDEESLTRNGLNRRVSLLAPEDSLLLKKPMMRLAHVGGKKLNKNEVAYNILRGWIAEGVKIDAEAPATVKIAIYPGPSRILRLPHNTQQLNVQATFADGTVRDVTAICTYDISHKDILSVDAHGHGHRRQARPRSGDGPLS